MEIDFKKIISQIVDFSEEEWNLIFKKFELKNFPKKELLVDAGNIAREVYFILSGSMRLFYIKEGEDISAYFFGKGMFGGAYDSFISQQPSRHYIETSEESTVLAINYKNFQSLLVEVPKMNELVRKVLEERFISLHQLFTAQILDSPEERYIHLIESRPELLQTIPQHQIATYLGITPVSLSRIRNRIMKK